MKFIQGPRLEWSSVGTLNLTAWVHWEPTAACMIHKHQCCMHQVVRHKPQSPEALFPTGGMLEGAINLYCLTRATFHWPLEEKTKISTNGINGSLLLGLGWKNAAAWQGSRKWQSMSLIDGDPSKDKEGFVLRPLRHSRQRILCLPLGPFLQCGTPRPDSPLTATVTWDTECLAAMLWRTVFCKS